jgi:hypothetical protein
MSVSVAWMHWTLGPHVSVVCMHLTSDKCEVSQ